MRERGSSPALARRDRGVFFGGCFPFVFALVVMVAGCLAFQGSEVGVEGGLEMGLHEVLHRSAVFLRDGVENGPVLHENVALARFFAQSDSAKAVEIFR